jgi:hypothetical protein
MKHFLPRPAALFSLAPLVAACFFAARLRAKALALLVKPLRRLLGLRPAALFYLAPLIAACFFAACAARISGPLRVDGSAEFNVSVSLEPRMTALIRGLSAAAGVKTANGTLLDGPAIAQSMAAAPGVESVSFKNTAPAAIEGPVKVAKINGLLASGAVKGGIAPFINFEQEVGGGRCLISLNRENGPRLLSLLSPDITGYLEALMAPIVTGENLSKTEYLSLVGMVYGEGIAGEIAGSTIRASIEFPGVLQSVKGGTFSGRRAEFAIPLLDLLVLETSLVYEAVWK